MLALACFNVFNNRWHICVYPSLVNTCIPMCACVCGGEWPSLVDKWHQQKVSLACTSSSWLEQVSICPSLTIKPSLSISLTFSTPLRPHYSSARKYIIPEHYNPHGTSNDFKEQLLFVSQLFLGFHPSSFSYRSPFVLSRFLSLAHLMSSSWCQSWIRDVSGCFEGEYKKRVWCVDSGSPWLLHGVSVERVWTA